MTILKRWALGVCAFILAGSAWSQAVTVADVKYEPTQTLGDSTVQLNGAGVRYKAVFRCTPPACTWRKKPPPHKK